MRVSAWSEKLLAADIPPHIVKHLSVMTDVEVLRLLAGAALFAGSLAAAASDTLQFCRFLPELGRRAGRVTLEAMSGCVQPS